MFIKKKMLKSGISLLEVMMAGGLLGVMSLGLMKMVEIQGNSNKKILQDFEINQVMHVMSLMMRNSKACLNTLSGKDPPCFWNVDLLT